MRDTGRGRVWNVDSRAGGWLLGLVLSAGFEKTTDAGLRVHLLRLVCGGVCSFRCTCFRSLVTVAADSARTSFARVWQTLTPRTIPHVGKGPTSSLISIPQPALVSPACVQFPHVGPRVAVAELGSRHDLGVIAFKEGGLQGNVKVLGTLRPESRSTIPSAERRGHGAGGAAPDEGAETWLADLSGRGQHAEHHAQGAGSSSSRRKVRGREQAGLLPVRVLPLLRVQRHGRRR